MSGYWQPSDVGVDPADYTDGQVPVKDASGVFVPSTPTAPTGDGWTLVESASQAGFDAATDAGAITAVFRWGIDSTGGPYFDSAGAVSGEEAALWITDEGGYVLVSLEV